MRCHEIHRFWGNFFRGHDKVAFVFAVGVIGHDHHIALGDFTQDILNRIKLERFSRLNNHGR